MVNYTTTILRFDKKAEKTGWTYIEIPPDIAKKLKPGFKKSFRVKGKLDAFEIKQVALLPMGDGGFIMPINTTMRKGIGKRHGAMLKVSLTEDKSDFVFNGDFIACLKDDVDAFRFFETLTPSHQKYFSKWIDSAKTDATKIKRITLAVNGLAKKMDYGSMLRASKGK